MSSSRSLSLITGPRATATRVPVCRIKTDTPHERSAHKGRPSIQAVIRPVKCARRGLQRACARTKVRGSLRCAPRASSRPASSTMRPSRRGPVSGLIHRFCPHCPQAPVYARGKASGPPPLEHPPRPPQLGPQESRGARHPSSHDREYPGPYRHSPVTSALGDDPTVVTRDPERPFCRRPPLPTSSDSHAFPVAFFGNTISPVSTENLV